MAGYVLKANHSLLTGRSRIIKRIPENSETWDHHRRPLLSVSAAIKSPSGNDPLFAQNIHPRKNRVGGIKIPIHIVGRVGGVGGQAVNVIGAGDVVLAAIVRHSASMPQSTALGTPISQSPVAITIPNPELIANCIRKRRLRRRGRPPRNPREGTDTNGGHGASGSLFNRTEARA